MAKTLEMDMTKGPILKQIIKVAVPLILMNLLQVLFNTADVTILGIFTNDNAVAGVGSSSSLVNLIVSLFTGLAVGVNIVVARALGSKNPEKVKKLIGVSIFTALVGGVILLIVGVSLSKTFLVLMNCDEQVLSYATNYLIIYFIGAPALLLYNFSAAILRASGETLRPFIYLSIGGAMNVVLNIFFIVAFGLDVEGVAIATVISTVFSAVMCLRLLIKNKDGVVKLEKKYIRFYKEEFKEIALVGIPSGVQSALFGISNVLIQSTVNSFGNAVMAGDTCAKQLEHFIGQVLPGISQAGVAFVSQNYGAKNFKRIKTSIFSGLLLILITGALVSTALILITAPFSRLMLTEKEAMEYTILRSKIMLTTFTVGSTMDYFAYVLRGLNKSITAMIITLVGVCLVRVLWIKLIFPLSPTLSMLYFCYPITWALTLIILLVCVTVRYINEKKKCEIEQTKNAYNAEIE